MSSKSVSYGTSLSVKYCRTLGLRVEDVLKQTLKDHNFQRFRLMSYWNEICPEPGVWRFEELDRQFYLVGEAGRVVTLAIGLRQPRWPECHAPKWVKELAESDREAALLQFIEVVVERYKDHPALDSYQLENEALNRSIGTCTNFDRRRLRNELQLVKRLDTTHPVLMSLSNSWGLPLRRPIPDQFGISLYRHQSDDGQAIRRSNRSPFWYRLRVKAIEWLWRKPVICHELQMEPWGTKSTEKLSDQAQLELMSPNQLREHLQLARESGYGVIDLWGLEWWYWRKTIRQDSSCWDAIREELTAST